MRYSLVGNENGEENIIAWVDGEILEASTGHPNFNTIKEAVIYDEEDYDVEEIKNLFNTERLVEKKFERLSERVHVANGQVYFDGDVVNSALTDQIMRFVHDGVEDWEPLVAFYEKLSTNPNAHSREQLYGWLNSAGEFTITDDGDFIAYKGVNRRGDEFVSVHSGSAIRNDEPVNGYVVNMPGDVITMPRGDVQFNPSVGCSTGLHAGTWEYASDFGQVVLSVRINPRDVVSVPTDCNEQKLRTCRYKVIDVVSEKSNNLVESYDDGDPVDLRDEEEYYPADYGYGVNYY